MADRIATDATSRLEQRTEGRVPANVGMTPHVLSVLGRALGCLRTQGAVDALSQLGEDEWPALIALAGEHLVTPQLAHVLGRTPTLDPEIEAYASGVAALGAQRAARIEAQRLQMLEAFGRAGVTPMLLKGAAYDVIGLYPQRGLRLYGDIDILVRGDEREAAITTLADLGYRQDPGLAEAYRLHHHQAPFVHTDWLAPIELHHQALRWQFQSLLPEEGLWREAQKVSDAGVNACLPSAHHLALHNTLNAQATNYRFWRGEIVLRDALDLVLLDDRFGDAIDWPRLIATMRAASLDAILDFYVRQAFMALDLPPPAGITQTWIGEQATKLWQHEQKSGAASLARTVLSLHRLLTIARRLFVERAFFQRLELWASLALSTHKRP